MKGKGLLPNAPKFRALSAGRLMNGSMRWQQSLACTIAAAKKPWRWHPTTACRADNR
jgi:hypothetical protein